MKNIQTFTIGILSAILLFGLSANAATWTVTKAANSDDNVCNADCSLREAVFNADSGDTVIFNSNLVGQTFTLGGSEIVITKRITIDGFINNPNVAFISGEMTSRIFLIEAGGALDLKNATLVQGNGASVNFDNGNGGAINAKDTAALSLNRVTIRSNSANGYSAIILRSGTHRFTNISITGNSGNRCPGILNEGANANLYMANVTLSSNFDSVNDGNSGGAICNSGGNLTIRNSTIAYNAAEVVGGGIFNTNSGNLNLGNTIVAQNTSQNSAPDIFFLSGTITSAGGNLIGNTQGTPAGTFTQPNDITGVNPLLGPTNSNSAGFPVLSHPLQAGSPARNGGINNNAVDPLTTLPLTFDTRGAGFPRITDTIVDIGAFEDQTGNTSLIVTKNANGNDLVCDTDCSLREAVFQASLNFGTETITFAPNVFGNVSTGGSEIVIQNQNVNIIGYPNLNAETLRITGGNNNRIFRLNNATANISGMALTGGDAGAGFGGAILSENGSNLTLNKMIVRNNFAAAYGAVYFSGGTGQIINSTINNNSANTGLAIGASGILNMANTTVSGNLDADGGTGIGAIYVTGAANIRNSTIAFNRTSGGTGGGIFNAGTLNIGNSIVANNLALTSPDIHFSSGAITSVGGNLISNSSGFPAGTFGQTNDAVSVNPLLDALAGNNGNVTTHSLAPNSPAINLGINANAVNPFDNSVLTTDARGGGYIRISNNTVDKGAFESLAATASGASVSGRVTNGNRGIARARVILTGSNGETRTATTNSFGYFSLSEVEAGQIYVVNVISKSYTFTPQIITVNEDLTDLNLSAETNEFSQ